MTASPGREVDANLLRGAALESAEARANPQDAGGQDLGDLVEPLGRGHEVGPEGLGQIAIRSVLRGSYCLSTGRALEVSPRAWSSVEPASPSNPLLHSSEPDPEADVLHPRPLRTCRMSDFRTFRD